MAHSQIFTQWRQPSNECYPSEWQQQSCHWIQHNTSKDEEKSSSHPYHLQQNHNQWRSSSGIHWQDHQNQQEFQHQWQNPPRSPSLHLQPNPWKQMQKEKEWQQHQQERLLFQDQWHALHGPTWQQHSVTWQHTHQPTQRECIFLNDVTRTSWHSQTNLRRHDNFEDLIDDIEHGQRKDNSEITGELFGDEMAISTEERERCKRKSSEMKHISEGYDTDDEEILPSCKRQRITVAAVERLLASFTISDNRPVRGQENFRQDKDFRQGDTIPLRDYNSYNNENNPHLVDSASHTMNSLGKQIEPFHNGIEIKLIDEKYSSNEDSTRANIRTHFINGTAERGVTYKSHSPGLVLDCKSGSCGSNLQAEFQLQGVADPPRHSEEEHLDSGTPLSTVPVLERDVSNTSNVVVRGEISERQKTSIVKVTFPNQDEKGEENEEDVEEGKGDKYEEKEAYDQEIKINKHGDVFKVSEYESESKTQADYINKNKENFPAHQHQETTYSRWEKKDANKSYEQEFQNNENHVQNINLYKKSCSANNRDNENSILTHNYVDVNDCTSERVSSISTVNNSAQNNSCNTNIFSSNDNSRQDKTRDPSNANTSTNYNTNTSCIAKTSYNTSNDASASNNDSDDVTSCSISVSSSKRSMEGGEATQADERSSQKRVRKLKSGLRLCSNITCYIEQVLYNC